MPFGLDPRIFALRCVMFFSTTGASSIARYMVLFLAVHFNTTQLGIIMGVRPAIRFIASFFWGLIGDCTQRRATIATLGMIVGILGYNALLVPFIIDNFYYTLGLMSVCQVFGSASCLLSAITVIILAEQALLEKLEDKIEENSKSKPHHASISIKEIDADKALSNKIEKGDDIYHSLPISVDEEKELNVHSNSESGINERKKKGGTAKYGSTRMWGAVGWGLGSVICGGLLWLFGENVLFIFYDANMLIVLAVMIFGYPIAIKIAKKHEQNIKKQFRLTLNGTLISSPTNHANDIDDIFSSPVDGIVDGNKEDDNDNKENHNYCSEFCSNISNFHSFLFLCNLFVCGTATSVVENFLFLFLTEYFGASAFLCGLTLVCMVSGEVPVFYKSEWLIHKVGLINLLTLSHAAYFVRVIGYTLIPETHSYYAWYILFIEPLHGLTFAGLWIASVEYGARITPNHLKGTMQGLMSGMYGGGLSGCIGCIMGGYIYQYYGPVLMYRYAGIIMLAWMVLFQICFRILKCLKPNSYAVNTLFGQDLNKQMEDEKRSKILN